MIFDIVKGFSKEFLRIHINFGGGVKSGVVLHI